MWQLAAAREREMKLGLLNGPSPSNHVRTVDIMCFNWLSTNSPDSLSLMEPPDENPIDVSKVTPLFP